MKKLALVASLALGLSACGAAQTDNCRKWLECQKAVNQATGASTNTEALHGPNGTCWNDPATAAVCDTDCSNGLKAAQANDKTKDLAACK
ncbi:MAG: hypothetical protein ACK4N5_16380 [Myxococcales bacterium]